MTGQVSTAGRTRGSDAHDVTVDGVPFRLWRRGDGKWAMSCEAAGILSANTREDGFGMAVQRCAEFLRPYLDGEKPIGGGHEVA